MASGNVEARQRNEQLVDRLERSGALRDPAVAAAFRAVLRHHFLPGRPLDEVYEDSPITTKIGRHGLPVSSSSQPAIMAIMLQLLQLLPGHRALEIGAGTGYNAALIAHLVGPGGHVVTLDIDEEVVEQARANLAAAGVEGVRVVHTDGARGWEPDAPYDRLIVTAGADDLSPAWAAQLVEGGRLVLPLGLALPTQHCVALVRHGAVLTSAELCPCGFMPLQGVMAPEPGGLDDPLAGWLAETGRPTGYAVPAADLRDGFGTWLALAHSDCVPGGRRRQGVASGLGLRDGHGAALVSDEAEEGHHPVLAFGRGAAAAARLIEAHRTWARRRPDAGQVRIAAHPTGEAPPPDPRGRALRRPNYTFVVRAA